MTVLVCVVPVGESSIYTRKNSYWRWGTYDNWRFVAKN